MKQMMSFPGSGIGKGHLQPRIRECHLHSTYVCRGDRDLRPRAWSLTYAITPRHHPQKSAGIRRIPADSAGNCTILQVVSNLDFSDSTARGKYVIFASVSSCTMQHFIHHSSFISVHILRWRHLMSAHWGRCVRLGHGKSMT